VFTDGIVNSLFAPAPVCTRRAQTVNVRKQAIAMVQLYGVAELACELVADLLRVQDSVVVTVVETAVNNLRHKGPDRWGTIQRAGTDTLLHRGGHSRRQALAPEGAG